MDLLRRLRHVFVSSLAVVVGAIALSAGSLVALDSWQVFGSVPASASQMSTPTTSPTTSQSTSTTTTTVDPNATDPATYADGLSVSDCVGHAVQLPGCGTKPTQAGDLGGSLQLTLFGLVMAGMGFIGWRIVRSVRQRDRILNG